MKIANGLDINNIIKHIDLLVLVDSHGLWNDDLSFAKIYRRVESPSGLPGLWL